MGMLEKLRGIFRKSAVVATSNPDELTRRLSVALRYALSSDNPGVWAADHREESRHVTGWSFVAIKTLAMQAANAQIKVFDDSRLSPGQREEAKHRRSVAKFKRLFHGAGYAKDYGSDMEESPTVGTNHPLMKILKRPNHSQIGALFQFERIVQIEATGTCLIWNAPNEFGMPLERYVLPMAMMLPFPPRKDYPRGGWKVTGGMSRWSFPLLDNGFVETTGYPQMIGAMLPAEQVQVMRWPHPLWKDDGYSALAAGSVMIDTGNEVQKSRFWHMKNQASPSVLITVPEELEVTQQELDEAAATINAKYGGSEKVGKVMFVRGAQVERLSQTGQEMAYDKAFEQYRDAELALHQTTPIAAGILAGGTYAALFAGIKQFTMLRAQPVFNLIAEEETMKFSPYYGDGLTIDMEATHVDDPDIAEKQRANDIAAGALTKGEWRAMRNLPPFGDQRDKQTVGTEDPGETKLNAAASMAGKPKPPGDDGGGNGTADHTTTGVDTGAERPKGPRKLRDDAVLKAAIRGALEDVETSAEVKRIIRSITL